MLRLDKDEFGPALRKLRDLPNKLKQWEREMNAARPFRLTIGKPAMKGPFSNPGGGVNHFHGIFERERREEEIRARLQAKADDYMKH